MTAIFATLTIPICFVNMSTVVLDVIDGKSVATWETFRYVTKCDKLLMLDFFLCSLHQFSL